MKIAGISTSSYLSGSGLAASKIVNLLNQNNLKTDLFVSYSKKISDNLFISNTKNVHKINQYLEFSFTKFLSKDKSQLFSPNLFSFTSQSLLNKLMPYDIIFLFWINAGFLNNTFLAKIFELNKKTIWRLSDMWPFTGGCHYSGPCEKFKTYCEKCPKIKPFKFDFVDFSFSYKKQNWALNNLTLVAPSSWMAEQARQSSLFKDVKIEIIPQLVNPEFNIQNNSGNVKDVIKLGDFDINNKIVLIGAFNLFLDSRKGGEKNIELILKLLKLRNITVIVFGSDYLPEIISKNNKNLINVGVITESHQLCKLYNISDIFVNLSVEENSSNTIAESLMCGTPVIAFKIGGNVDIVHKDLNGVLINNFDIDLVVNSIIRFLNNDFKRKNKFEIHKKAVKDFGSDVILDKFINLLY